MPGMDGIETLKEIKKDNPQMQVIIITGHGTIETAVKATKLGAFDFIEKPLSIDKVIVSINNALNFRRLEEENRYLRKKTLESNSISGTSAAILELKKQIAVTAPTDAWVLISGENGTGKELVARSVHLLSSRAEQPLITINCAAIPEERIEYELFGYEKGAFEGAKSKKRGRLELADQGTLFFDEIGDMPLKTQAKLLRVLEDQKFQKIGGGRDMAVNIRVIAASNKDLEKEIEAGNFREDLYYRLNVVPIEVPPLRNRTEDIAILLDTFLNEAAIMEGDIKKKISPGAMEALKQYVWPGNVRELKNLAERLSIMVDKEIIEKDDLPAPYHPISVCRPMSKVTNLLAYSSWEQAQREFEKAFIDQKMIENQNNILQAALAMGVEEEYLAGRLKALK
jgi:two-component system nitrogen regulation response regulator NtrX